MSADLVASRTPARATFSWQPVWWIEERSALSVDAFRILAGAALTAHFVVAARDLPVAVGQRGLYAAGEDPSGGSLAHAAFVWLDAYVSWARVVTSAGLLLSVAILLGIAPRLCAFALFLVSTWIHRVAFAVSTLDDSVVVVVAFWLCLRPIGKTLNVAGIGRQERWRETRVEGWTSLLFVTHLLLLQTNLTLWRAYAPTWYAAGPLELPFLLVGACFLLPGRIARLLGIVAWVALHVALGLRSGLLFTHAAAVSAALLLCATRDASIGHRPSIHPFSANAVAGAVLLVLELILQVNVLWRPTSAAEPRSWALATGKLLSDVGLRVTASGVRLPPRPFPLRFESASATEEVRVAGQRSEMLLARLTQPRAADDNVAVAVVQAAARVHCRDHSTETGTIWLVRDELGVPNVQVADYQCDADAVKLLGARQ